MENNVEILEKIMKPYFEKIEELKINEEQKRSENLKRIEESKKKEEDRQAELKFLNFRLQKLLDNKEEEIAMVSRSNSSYIYVENIRKEIESAYKEREEALRNEIEKLENSKDSNLENNIEIENPNKFHKVDVKEMINIKYDIKRNLNQERNRLNLELKQQQVNFDSVILELSNFKYEYNDQHQVINGDSWRNLYEQSNEIADKITDIRNSLNQVEQYLKLTQLTNEEISIGMMTLTPWEQDEYNRRLEIKNKASKEEEINNLEEIENSNIIKNDISEDLDDDIIDIPQEDFIDVAPEVINDLDIIDLDEVFEFGDVDREIIGELEEEPQPSENLDEEVFNIPSDDTIDLDSLDEETFNIPNNSEEFVDINQLGQNSDDTIRFVYPNNSEEFVDINQLGQNSDDTIRFVYPNNSEEFVDDMIIENDPIQSNFEEIDGKMVVETYDDLLMSVYNEIMEEIENIRSLRLDSSRIAQDEYHVSTKEEIDSEYNQSGFIDAETKSGEYINEEDFNLALQNYYAKDKGKTFIVKEVDKEFKISKGTIRKMKKQLKSCTSLKLVKDSKLSTFDLYRVHGKDRNEKKYGVELGEIQPKSENMDGDYINRNELVAKLDSIFKEKKTSWLKKVADKFRSRREYDEEEEYYYDTEEVEYTQTR